MSKTYTEKDMLILYATIDKHAKTYEDFPNYQRALVDKLQELFEVNLKDWEGKPTSLKVLYMLFQSTVRSYSMAIVHPTYNYTDATLLHITLREKTGETGLEINSTLTDIWETSEQKQQHYEKLLFQLYDAIWGASGKVITDDDLAKAGFDTSKEPKWSDYIDYM